MFGAGERPIEFAAQGCTLSIRRPAPGVTVIQLAGRDLGKLGDAPFVELKKDLATSDPLRLFIDARKALSATMEVSGSWAVWLGANSSQLAQVDMLTSSPIVQISARVVRRFSGLGEKMSLHSDPVAFDAALQSACAQLPSR